jgi:pepF/M3 family oligoendopeptidase
MPAIEERYHWDLTNVFPSLESEAFNKASEDLSDQIDDLAAYMSDEEISGIQPLKIEDNHLVKTMEGYLNRINAVRRQYRTLSAYLYSFTTTDSFNIVAKRLLSKLQMEGSRIQKLEVRFQSWIGIIAQDDTRLEELLSSNGPVKEHAFFIRETADQSRYLMSDPEEALAAELSLSGSGGWEKLQGVVASQLKARFEEDDQVKELPITVVQNYRSHPDGEIRRRAFKAENAAWASVREPLAACLNGVKGEVNTLNRRRGREDALASSLESSRIDRETLHAMLSAMADSFPSFRRYYQAKAQLLGLQRLPWWDLFAPIGESEMSFSFKEARNFILKQFGTFSKRLVSLVEAAFDNAWIDAQPREGKVGGAFCMSVPGVEESRILCNFDGSLDQVATLAHELGHAYHNHCLKGKTPLQRRVPMTLAETASIFNQTIITDALLAESPTDDEKLSILESFLMDSGQVVVDIYSRYLFEKEVFIRREKSELSADELCELMVSCQRQTYGDGLDENHLNPYMWAWKPHYYHAALSFYNYPYAFGLLFGLGLYRIYQQEPTGYLDKYDKLLRDSGEYTAADLAARFGIDIRDASFWRGSLEIISDRIDAYISLTEQK